MPQPIPFQRRLPPHLIAPPRPAPETAEQRQARQLHLTRELTDLNMIAARDAAHRIATRDPDIDPAEAPASQDPTLALARATRAVTMVINVENRIAAGERVPFTIDDPRGVALRKLLHPIIMAHEPDAVRRRTLKLRVNERIDDALGADLDDDFPLAHIAILITEEYGLPLDLTKVPDEYLGPPIRPAYNYPRPEADHRDHR